MSVLRFIVALIWGSLSAQLFLQAVISFVIAVVYFVALIFSKVRKSSNATGGLVSFGESFLFIVLFGGGNWLISYFIDWENWNASSVAGLASFLLTLLAMSPQVPGRVLLAHKCAWVPDFFEASNCVPPNERVAFARRHSCSGPQSSAARPDFIG